jgi:hypothetical protein
VTEEDLLKRSDGFLKTFIASFRQAAANGNFWAKAFLEGSETM